jgi:dTDP-glucose 4,6-dehydratase
MRIVVTGGLGFIGSHFVERVVLDGHSVLVLDKETYAGMPENLLTVPEVGYLLEKTDIADSDALATVFSRHKDFDVVVNFAAESHVDRSIVSSKPFLDTNIVGTVNLLELVRQGVVARMVQVSTDEVYGSITHGAWDEDSPLDPRSPYSSSKASADFFCLAYKNTHGIDVRITRCSNNYGPRQSVEKLIPLTIMNCISGADIPVYGDGKNRREWLYVTDHVDAIMRVMLAEKLDYTIFNIGGVERENIEIVNSLLNAIDKTDSKIRFVEDRKGHDFRYAVDSNRIRNSLGWQSKVSFEDALQATVAWYLNNPKWIRLSAGKVRS